jgi:hypothetical protein
MLDKILYEVDSNHVPTVIFITLFVNRYDSWLFPLVRQFLFVPDQHLATFQLYNSNHNLRGALAQLALVYAFQSA